MANDRPKGRTKMRKLVVGTFLTLDGLLQADVAEAVARLKRSAGDEIQVHGSGDLIQTLLAHDLVDELQLWVFPVSVGKGKRLFAGGTLPRALALVDTKISTTGVAIHIYRVAGAIRYGSFAVDEHGQTDALWRDEGSEQRSAWLGFTGRATCRMTRDAS